MNHAQRFFSLKPLLFKGKNEMRVQAGARSGAATASTRRIVLILIAGVLLSVLLIGRAAWLAGKGAKEDAVEFEELCIPGLRGSILNRDGKLLAWSERHLRLVWQLPQECADALASRTRLCGIPQLRTLLPAEEKLPDMLGRKLALIEVLSGSLDPALLEQVENGDLLLEGYFIRHVSSSTAVIGRVAVDPVSGLELGVSGLEKEFDQRLRGRVLRYARESGSSKLTRLYNSFFSDSGHGENVVVDLSQPESF